MSRARDLAVDVFAGCGGLSLGLRRAGFDIAAAVEIDQPSAKTYELGNPRTKVLIRDVREVSGMDIRDVLDGQQLALLAGCAPCQGFSSLTAKNKKEDPRNKLVLEMARLSEELKPDAVFMENVPGLATRGKALFEQFLRQLRSAGYYPVWRIVQMADYGVPQYRRRLVLLAGRGFAIPFPEPSHAKKPAMNSGLRAWPTLQQAIGRRKQPLTLSQARTKDSPRKQGWHIVRDIKPVTVRRLQAATPGKTWLTVDEEVRPPCHRGDYRGFTNVYGRMSWEQTPVTITSGCTTPCKGRFGHPEADRTTISVREAATIQTFPEDYDFASDYIDRVCDMIGQAVPPRFAEVVGKQLLQTVSSHHAALAR